MEQKKKTKIIKKKVVEERFINVIKTTKYDGDNSFSKRKQEIRKAQRLEKRDKNTETQNKRVKNNMIKEDRQKHNMNR